MNDIVVTQAYTFMLVFTRVGTAMMVMPGVGDGFVPARVRLLFALGFCAIVSPIVAPYLPETNVGGLAFVGVLVGEFMLGAFIGGVARIFMTALDTAGMLVSMHMGLANAQVFNPAFATQGSIMGAFLSVTGALVLFATNLHHLIFIALIESYQSFPPGNMTPDLTSDLAQGMAKSVSKAFEIGYHFAVPFILVTTMVYVSMGILSRLMPQLQVFILSMPLQITIGLITFMIVISAGMLYWLAHYEAAIYALIMPFAR